MARGKATKKEALSMEERLEQALVADWEQPYKVPDNWIWTKVNILCDLQNGEKKKNRLLPYLEAKYLRGKVNSTVRDSGNFVAENSKVILVDGENSGEVFHISEDGYMGSTFKKLSISDIIHNNLFECFISIYQDEFRNSKTGSAIPHLNKELFYNLSFPLPPLNEQQRIVDRIESLFSKLDEAKEKAQTALDSFENRKAAILHRAFTGELTAKWREENGVGLDSWKETVLQDECEKITCGKTPTNDISVTGEIPFLKVYNIVDNKIEFDYKAQYIPASVSEAKLKSSILKPNDVVMNIVGPPLRKIAIIPNTYPQWNMNQAIVRFRVKNRLNPHFLYYSLIYPYTLDEVIAETKGVVGQANISVTQSRNLKIFRPSLPEQTEIVRILDSIFEKEKQAKELASVIEKIDLMKKAILARAFRGELGTNDPGEESAMELLKEMLKSTI